MKHSSSKTLVEIAENSKAIKILTGKKLLLVLSAVLAMAIVAVPVFLTIYERNNPDNYDSQGTIFSTPLNTETVTITPEEYSLINEGMSYEDVCSIVGGEGEIIQKIDFGADKNFAITTYEWTGESDESAVADIVFKNGVVLSKTQSNLITE